MEVTKDVETSSLTYIKKRYLGDAIAALNPVIAWHNCMKCVTQLFPPFQVTKIQTELQDTISQLKSLQDVLQTSQKEVQEKGKKVEELDKMLNESMEELQQKDKNLKEKESKVVELDKALKERQWELKQKAAQVRSDSISFSLLTFLLTFW